MEKALHKQFAEAMFTFLEQAGADAEKRAPGLSGILAEGEVADYVISSLVGAELGYRLKDILASSYTKKFGSAIPVSETTQDRTEKFRRCIERLTAKHTEDLWALAGKVGRVYMANTAGVRVISSNGSGEILCEEFCSSLMDQFEERNKPRTTRYGAWHWIAGGKDYLVTAMM